MNQAPPSANPSLRRFLRTPFRSASGLAVPRLAVLPLAVLPLAVLPLAVLPLAVLPLAVLRLAVLRLAVLRLAVPPLAVPCLIALGFSASACNRSDSKSESSVASEAAGADDGADVKEGDTSNGARRRYDVERGVIEFTLDGMQIGKETLKFKNYGLLEVKHSDAKISLPKGLTLPTGADPGERKLVTIIDGTTTVNYDPTTKAGTKLLNTLELLGGEEKFKGKSMAAMGEEMYTNMGGKKTGTKTVAGLSCDVWKIEKLGTESCIHKGITLEVTTELVGMKQHSIATKVDFDAKVDDAAFTVPADVQLRVTDLKKQGVVPGAGLPSTPGRQGQPLSPQEALRLMRESTTKKAE